MHGADSDAGIDIAVTEQHPHATPIPAPGRFLRILDHLHGRGFGRARESAGPHVRQQGVKSVTIGAQLADHVINGMEQARIRLNQPPRQEYFDSFGQ